MNFGKIGSCIGVAIVGIIILNLLTANHLALQDAAGRGETGDLTRLHFVRIGYGLSLGLLVRWRWIVKRIKERNKPVFTSLTFVSGLVLLFISIFPPIAYLQQFGLSTPFPQSSIGLHVLWAPFNYGMSQTILSVLAGILLVEGLDKSRKQRILEGDTK